jgi:hypothetical protein
VTARFIPVPSKTSGRLGRLLAVAWLAMMPVAEAAATSLKDLQIGIRGVSFLTEPPQGRIPVAVIHDGQSRSSQQDAAAIAGWLAAEGRTARVELQPVLVDIRELGSAQAFRVAFISAGMTGHFQAISDYARQNGTLTITADLACVKAGGCVLGVTSDPAVEVTLSRQASQASGVDFVRAFRMMVKEY